MFKNYSVGLLVTALAILSISSTIFGINFSQNNQGTFYVSGEQVLYFKGTYNGTNYSNFIPITGPNRAINFLQNWSGNPVSVYTTEDGFAVLTTRGELYKIGENTESIFGGSNGHDMMWTYSGG